MTNRDPNQGWREHVLGMLPKMLETNTGPAGFTPAPTVTVPAPTSFSLPPGPPQHDVIEALPVAAQDRLRALRVRAADAHRLIPPFEEQRELSMERIEAQNRLKQLQAHPAEHGHGLPDDAPQVIAATKHLAKLTDDLKRLNERSEDRAAAWRAAAAPVTACEDFLRLAVPGNCKLEAVEVVEPPKLTKGEGLLDCVERLRRDGRRIKADIHRVRSACYTQAEAMALVSATVENWGSNGIDTSATIEHLLQPTIPTKTVQAIVHNVPGAPAAVVFVEVPDVIGIFSTVLKDQFIAWLAADVDRNADPKGALSHEARQRQEAELMGDLLSIERDESAAVWAAQSEGLRCEHRSDCDPRAILQVQLITVPRASEAAGTSPGLSWDYFSGGRR